MTTEGMLFAAGSPYFKGSKPLIRIQQQIKRFIQVELPFESKLYGTVAEL